MERQLSEEQESTSYRQDANFVQLMVKFEGTQVALVAISGLFKELSGSQIWTAELSEIVEKHTNTLGGNLAEIAWQILAREARTPGQLAMKAKVLKYYCEESPHDLTSALVTSVCEDIMSYNAVGNDRLNSPSRTVSCGDKQAKINAALNEASPVEERTYC